MRPLLLKYPWLQQIIRYGITGIFNNVLGYLLYLLITFFWLEPKIVITIFYPLGATVAYFSHLKYSFSYKGKRASTVLRYALVYFIGYGLNFIMLLIFSDTLKFPHELVQASAILVVSAVLFIMLKYFVFPYSSED